MKMLLLTAIALTAACTDSLELAETSDEITGEPTTVSPNLMPNGSFEEPEATWCFTNGDGCRLQGSTQTWGLQPRTGYGYVVLANGLYMTRNITVTTKYAHVWVTAYVNARQLENPENNLVGALTIGAHRAVFPVATTNAYTRIGPIDITDLRGWNVDLRISSDAGAWVRVDDVSLVGSN